MALTGKTCNQYVELLGLQSPCNEYAHGTQLTEKGQTALVYLLGGGITLLVLITKDIRRHVRMRHLSEVLSH